MKIAIIGQQDFGKAVLEAFVGRCQACGRPAERRHEGSILVNLVQLEGTLYGDTFCEGCIDQDEVAGPVVALPPLPNEFFEEEGE